MFNNFEFGQNYDYNEIGSQLLSADDISAPFNCSFENQGLSCCFPDGSFENNNLPLVPFNFCLNNDMPPMESAISPDYYEPMNLNSIPDEIHFDPNSFNPIQQPIPMASPSPQMQYCIDMNQQQIPDQPFFDNYPTFEDVYNDSTCILNPMELHLLPEKYWSQQPSTMTFAQIVNTYFKQNRTQNSTFMLKLYNLLLISIQCPILEKALGARWLNDNVIDISRSGLINIFNVRENTVDGSMFHRQGNFSTHKFIEINESNFQQLGFYEYPKMPRIQGDTKFFIHEPHVFTRRPMTEAELKMIRYSNEAKKTYRSRIDVSENP